MATSREIRKRIKSVSSTKKITNTMEMISTVKMKKMQDRLNQSKPYSLKLNQVISNLRESGLNDIYEPLSEKRKNLGESKALILLITGNRGLCGGYNTNVINSTISFKDKLINEEKKEVLLYVIGKKGFDYFKFNNESVYKNAKNLEDKLTFNDAFLLGGELINLFERDDVDEVYISYTKILSSSSQQCTIERLLPITLKKEDMKIEDVELATPYIFEPNPYKIFSSLLPLYIKNKIYISVLESGFSEQYARRVAMKNATDAANDMVKDLTIKYNRARQAKITSEIAEIVGGASALE